MNPEYSEEFEQKPLPFKLIEDWDAQEVVQGKKRLEALLNGDVTPHDAAMAFHTTVIRKANIKSPISAKTPRPSKSQPRRRGARNP